MSLNFTSAETLSGSTGVPEAVVSSKGTTEAGQTLGIDLAGGVIRLLVEFPLPQSEEEVGARLGKKDKDGVQNVTSRIYGKSSNQAIYVKDGEGNVMKLAARLFAPVAGVEEEDAADV